MGILSREVLIYCEAALGCLIALVIILHYRNRRLNNNTEKIISSVIVYASIIYVVCDMGCAVVDSADIEFLDFAVYFFSSFVYIAGSVVVYVWVIYAEFLTSRKLSVIKGKCLLAAVPLGIDVILVLLTPLTGLYYRLEGKAVVKGQLYHVHYIIIIAYAAVIFTRMLYRMYKTDANSIALKDRYYHNVLFSIPLLSSALIQLFLFGHPAYLMGLMLFVLVTQLSSTTRMVTADELTGINNRNQLVKFLEGKMHSYSMRSDNQNSLFLFIMDVDNFKKINDSYGHIEGDEALCLVADTLKKMSGKYNCFCSRYGGDEFVMVVELYDANSAEAFSKELNIMLAEKNNQAGNDYQLQMSIGYAEYDDTTGTIADFIDRADKMLYRVKKIRKAGR